MRQRYFQRVNQSWLTLVAVAVFLGLTGHILGCGSSTPLASPPAPANMTAAAGHSPCEPEDHSTVCVAAQNAVVISRPDLPVPQLHALAEQGDTVATDATQTRIWAKSLPGCPVASSVFTCVWLT